MIRVERQPDGDGQGSAALATGVLVAVSLAGGARLAWWYWPDGVFSDATSGTWTALAWDMAHGEFYRPVLAPAGYGGTRYMPVFFSLYSLLLRARIDPVRAGILLMQGSVVAAALALYAALRAGGVRTRLALPSAGTVWATMVYQRCLSGVRADYLAAALTTAGVAAALWSERRRAPRWLIVSAACCLVGGLTKMTSVLSAAPVALMVAREGRRGTALRFVAGVAAGFVAALGGFQVASHGHFLENIRATVSAGMHVRDLWRHGVPSFGLEMLSDPFSAAPVAAAGWCVWKAARRRTWSLVHLSFVAVLGSTVVILASPGTASNHLVDLQMASMLVVGVSVAGGQLPSRVVTGGALALALVMTFVSWPVPGLPSNIRTLAAEGPHRRAGVAAVRHALPAPPALYLSTDPLLPILSGERPIVLDTFNLNLFLVEGTAAGQDITRRIREQVFGAIVLRDGGMFPRDMGPGDPDFDACRARYWAGGSALVRLVHTTYEIGQVRRPFVIARPIAGADGEHPLTRRGGN